MLHWRHERRTGSDIVNSMLRVIALPFLARRTARRTDARVHMNYSAGQPVAVKNKRKTTAPSAYAARSAGRRRRCVPRLARSVRAYRVAAVPGAVRRQFLAV